MLLKKGDKGDDVRDLQTLLDGNGFWTYYTITDYFGDVTETSVKNFQKSKQITVDGIVGNTTYGYLIDGVDIDTDRTNFDDSHDTDDKLNYLGSYITEDGLEIDRAYLDGDEYVKDYGKIQPENFFIHHTAGWNNPYNTINSWNKDSRGRVATQYCIGGTSVKVGSYGDDKYNGQVVECFPDNYIGWHLGKVGNFNMSKYSSAVEINNFGYLTKKDGKYYTYVNTEVPESMVCDLGYEFRGYQYWHSYTPEQIESLRLLIKHTKSLYPNIDMSAGLPQLLKDGVHPKDAFGFNEDAYYGRIKGLWTHTNVRKGKFDCFPQTELVDLLKSL